VVEEFTSTELSLEAGTVPSESLDKDIEETIQRNIQRDIAVVQMEARKCRDSIVSPNAKRAYRRMNSQIGVQYVDNYYDAWVSRTLQQMELEEETMIDALLKLGQYRLDAYYDWKRKCERGRHRHSSSKPERDVPSRGESDIQNTGGEGLPEDCCVLLHRETPHG
jgi:hypothetical protein